MKEKIKLVIVFIIGILISVVISVYAAIVIGASEVSFNESTSNIKYNNLTANKDLFLATLPSGYRPSRKLIIQNYNINTGFFVLNPMDLLK